MLLKRYKGLSVVNGDGTDVETLKRAGIEVADVLVAAMEVDGANITITQHAKALFGLPQVITFVNNSRNIKIAKRAGADVIICPFQHAVEAFERAIKHVGVATLIHKKDEDYKVVEFLVFPHSPLIGKKLGGLTLPKKCRIGMVRRGSQNLIPDENFSFQAMDKLLIYGTVNDVEKVLKVLEKFK